MLIDYIKRLQKYSALRPLSNLGKKYVYNPYLRSRLALSDFPPEVWIENTDVCNARCIMCPRQNLTRQLGFMKFSLFRKDYPGDFRTQKELRGCICITTASPCLTKNCQGRLSLPRILALNIPILLQTLPCLHQKCRGKLSKRDLMNSKVSFTALTPRHTTRQCRGLILSGPFRNLKDFSG